jgi:hypothetical protein
MVGLVTDTSAPTAGAVYNPATAGLSIYQKAPANPLSAVYTPGNTKYLFFPFLSSPRRIFFYQR